MSLKAIESQYVNGIRVTTADALVCVKEAAGEARLDIEAAFSQAYRTLRWPTANAESSAETS